MADGQLTGPGHTSTTRQRVCPAYKHDARASVSSREQHDTLARASCLYASDRQSAAFYWYQRSK